MHTLEGIGFDYYDPLDILLSWDGKSDLSRRATIVEDCIGILERGLESEKFVRNGILLLSTTLHEWGNDLAMDRQLLENIDISRVKEALGSVISNAKEQAFNPQLEAPKRIAW